MYVVIHTQGQSVEAVLGVETREGAIDKALEIAVRSGFFNPEAVEGITLEDMIRIARNEIQRDHCVVAEVPREDQRVTVKRMFVASADNGVSRLRKVSNAERLV